MKTKILIPLFLLALVSSSLYSCIEDTVDNTAQKNNAIPKVSAPVADEGNNKAVEPVITNPK